MHWRKSQSEEISLILLILSRSDQGKNCGPASKKCSRPRTTVKTLLWAELLHTITIKGEVCIFHGQCHRSFAKETVCKVASSPFLKISSHKEIQPPLTESYVRKHYINGVKKFNSENDKYANAVLAKGNILQRGKTSIYVKKKVSNYGS